ncbi:MAG TPA: hypothetical protein VLY63_17370 [Anaerolineae bacterium]|nr:hypothetical protein [Anaerolineae bacterium]
MIKRLVFGILSVLGMLATAGIAVVDAATLPDSSAEVGPYEGRFYGTARGDADSHATLALYLTHRGNQVKGIVFLGEGLYVDGGICGEGTVPATVQFVEGHTESRDPRRLAVTPTFDVGGLELSVDFEGTVSADGEVISADAKVDLPWFCGRDPSLTGILHRK